MPYQIKSEILSSLLLISLCKMLQMNCRGSSQIVDIWVTVDGRWQRRGYTLMNGVVVAVSVDMGKVLDIEVLSRFCKSCSSLGRILKDDPQEFDTCHVNYTGTAPAIEVEGAKRMFERSITNRSICYTSYYGGGDRKAYETVNFVYRPDKPVQNSNVLAITRNMLVVGFAN